MRSVPARMGVRIRSVPGVIRWERLEKQVSDIKALIAEARLAQCSECSEEGTGPAMRCDGYLILRLADALESRAVPSVSDREALVQILAAKRWHTNESLGKQGADADAILAAGFSRTSQPVQVEVTDELLDAIISHAYESESDPVYQEVASCLCGWSEDLANLDPDSEPEANWREHFRAALSAALGGGD